uniref:Dinoflagellate luciferase N-terminal domain-containing protein n=1 Tax=Alexandrium catenella TaxID=2925 RepID=A0A7S1M0G3_ALECA
MAPILGSSCLCPRIGARFPHLPSPKQFFVAMSALGAFLQSNGLTDAKVINYMTQKLQLESVADFASYWTSDEFEKGVQTDIVQQVADVSLPASKLQIARLRAAWKVAQNQAAAAPVAAKTAASGQVVGMGWTSPEVTTSTWDGLWEALIFKARNPQKFKMNVSDVVVADRPGYLARSMTIVPTGKRMQEHIYASERKGEIIYRVVDPETKRETDDERVIAVKESPLRMEFFHRHVSDGYRSFWQAPLDSVKQMVQELVDYAAQTEGKGGVVGLGIRSEEIKGVSHDSVWRSMMESIREPARFFACSNVSIKECKGFLQRTVTANGETYLENIYSDEPSCEIVYRKLVNGAETDIERVVALRTHPLQIEFHQRNTADGFRVQWDMPKSAPLGGVEAFVREAKRMDGAQPTTVGYGITSDPIRELSYDSVFAAVALSVKEPWRVIDVDQTGCSVQDCAGYTQRKMKLTATGENVVERITINEETGTVTYNKCDASGRPGDVERVLAIHTPLRLEFYERSASSGLRVDWKAPFEMARQTFSNIAQLAKQLQSSSSDFVGYGLASKPFTSVSQDALWRAMLYAMRNPAECGLKVDGVRVQDMSGYMQRTMRILEKPGSPTVTDNIRVIESAQEITYRPVVNGEESEEERVFALRTEPLRLEMFCRHSKDEMRLDWQAPRSVCLPVFDTTAAAAQRM